MKREENNVMSDWQPNLYLEYGRERTQPSIDLVTRIDHRDPKRIIDIGCGPGNSTNVLRARWPQAEIIGLDSSEAMIEEAKSKHPAGDWICADATGDLAGLGTFDIVFSNAAIQWMPNQDLLLAHLFDRLNPNGVLAVQIPCTKDMQVQIELMEIIESDKWRRLFEMAAPSRSVNSADLFYDVLCGLTSDIDLWETIYFHVMKTHNDIVKWYSGTALRPYLDCLKDDSLSADFLQEFENALEGAYPAQADGKILFPFTRIFFIAKNRHT